jgi:hypothetical protein
LQQEIGTNQFHKHFPTSSTTSNFLTNQLMHKHHHALPATQNCQSHAQHQLVFTTQTRSQTMDRLVVGFLQLVGLPCDRTA